MGVRHARLSPVLSRLPICQPSQTRIACASTTCRRRDLRAYLERPHDIGDGGVHGIHAVGLQPRRPERLGRPLLSMHRFAMHSPSTLSCNDAPFHYELRQRFAFS